MRKAVLALAAAAAVAGCNRQSTYETPRSSAPSSAGADETWVAQPSDLSEEQVRQVQRALTGRGFQVDATGTFDAATQTALAEFQRSRGLPATGNLNADTAAALGISPDDVRPSRTEAATAPGPTDTRTGTSQTAAEPAGEPGQPPDAADARTEPSSAASGAPPVDR
jgi:peptidoglycan hydrolase-like protein with peptidoglycan-binding domain